MRTHWRALVAAGIVLIVASGTAAALHGSTASAPGTRTLGVDENDVRDEPSHPKDGNGFQEVDPFFSPKDDALVLEAFVVPGTGYQRQASADVRNFVNVALHGENYGQYERTMYPGVNRYAAYWGWWSDTGSGGNLQSRDAASAAPGVGEADGAIDHGHDCKQRPWDEFTHRGDHPCPKKVDHAAHPDDEMFAFIQPGTHDLHTNSLYSTWLSSAADGRTEPDFAYRNYDLRWEEVPRPADLEYDSSALITTEVVTAVNPRPVDTTGPTTSYEPFEADGTDDHAVDVDVYTTPHPLVEQGYRTSIWDPGDQEGSPADALHANGLKGWAKDDGATLIADAQEAADETVASVVHPTEGARGAADDLAQGPFQHEPNTAADRYGLASDGTSTGWATFDDATSYGGLDGDYYEPGPNQAYEGYQPGTGGERFWMDAQVRVNHNVFPPALWWDRGVQLTPELPSAEAPAESTSQEGDDNTQGPGFMRLAGYFGIWYDANDDGWVGDAGEDGHPYDNGTTDDPNDYASDEFRSRNVFGKDCCVDIDATLYPTSDTDGDGTKDWGAAGVYVMDPMTLTYGSPWMDVVADDADPVLDPVRQELGPWLSANTIPERQERFASYRRVGPIELSSFDFATVVMPTGTMDFSFKSVTTATLTDGTSKEGDTSGSSLAGQTIRDVDRYEAVVEAGP